MSSIDVIVPCYNYGRFLRACIASVTAQEAVDVRVLIIDDSSADDTPEIGTALAREDRRVEFRRHQSNHGHIATYNEGLEWAAHDYVLILSADDGLAPGALRRAARVLDDRPDMTLAYGRQIAFATTWPDVPDADDFSFRVLGGAEFIETASAVGHNPVATPTAVVRSTAQRAVGGYRAELPHAADLNVWLRVAAIGSVGVLDIVQAVKRSHDRNMQLAFTATALRDLIERRAAFDAFFRERPGGVDVERMKTLAASALAKEAFWAASAAFDEADSRRCDDLLAFAADVYPNLVHGPEWSRLKWKRRIGSRASRAARFLVGRLQEGPAQAPAK